MSNVQLNPQGSGSKFVGGLYEKLYRPGQFIFTAPGHIDNFVKNVTEKEGQNVVQKAVINPVLKTLGWFGKNVLSYDYNKLIPVGKLRVAQAPMGALMMMFLPFTIMPRMIQALKRGEGDKSEFMDIIRRDIPTIGILLFALDPLVRKLNIIKSRFDGMTIVEPKEAKGGAKKAFGEVFSYSKLEKIFKIDVKNHNPNVLYEIASQGNETGMRNALKRITRQWAGHPQLGAKKAKEIGAFNKAVTGMLDELAKGEAADKTIAQKLSAEAFEAMKNIDNYRGRYFQSLSEKELPKVADFLSRHAKTRRLPIDILSFALVCVGVGWLPVWFNDRWNKKKFAEKQAAAGGAQMAGGHSAPKNIFANPNFDPAATFRALKESSRLGATAPSASPFTLNPQA